MALILFMGPLITSCSYATKTPVDKLRFVEEREAVRIIPKLSVASVPSKTDPLMKISVSKIVYGPIYEVQIDEELSKQVSYNPAKQIGTILGIGLTAGLILLIEPQKTLKQLTGVEVKPGERRRVRGEPRRTGESGEVQTLWGGGTVKVEINDAVSREFVADDQGELVVDLSQGLGLLERYPRDSVSVRVSSESNGQVDSKIFQLDGDTAGALYLRGADMAEDTPQLPPKMVAQISLEERDTRGSGTRRRALVVEVRNDGEGATSQLKGLVRSTYSSLDRRELMFGKVAPGRVREWVEEVEIPPGAQRPVLVRVTFSERNGFAPREVAIEIRD